MGQCCGQLTEQRELTVTLRNLNLDKLEVTANGANYLSICPTYSTTGTMHLHSYFEHSVTIQLSSSGLWNSLVWIVRAGLNFKQSRSPACARRNRQIWFSIMKKELKFHIFNDDIYYCLFSTDRVSRSARKSLKNCFVLGLRMINQALRIVYTCSNANRSPIVIKSSVNNERCERYR